MNLRQLLEEYKKLTLILIEKAKNGEELEEEINKSNNILKEIKKLNYKEEDIKNILKEFNIPELENELSLTIKKEMVKIKKQIEAMRNAKKARKMYRVSAQPDFQLFHKRI